MRLKNYSWLKIGLCLGVGVPVAAVHASSAIDSDVARYPSLMEWAKTGSYRDSTVLDRTVSIKLDRASAEAAISAVEKQIGVSVWYRRELLAKIPAITIKEKTTLTVRAFFERLLAGTKLQAVVIDGGEIAIVERGKAFQKERPQSTSSIYGKVIDLKSGRALYGATVSLTGTSVRSTTDANGNYVLKDVPGGAYIIQAQSLGFAPTRVPVTIRGGADTTFALSLEQVTTTLSEIVTTATGTRERMEVGNDVVTLDVPSILANRPVPDVTTLLESRVQGLTVQRSSGQPGAASRILIRGAHSGRASNDPIIILDGIRVNYDQSNQEQYVSPLDQIDVNSIETIEVLKGPSAASLYGTDAANGVIVITTKRGKVGPARWSFTYGQSQQKLPGKYPNNYVLWGTGFQGEVTICEFGCEIVDSVSAFQWVNHPGTNPFGTGSGSRYNASVNGGNSGVTYSLNLGHSQELGMIKMPDLLAKRYQEEAMGRPMPESQRRPDRMVQQQASAAININLADNADANISSSISRFTRRNSGLSGAVSALTQLGPVSLYDLSRMDIIPRARQQIVGRTTAARTGVTTNWRPFAWLATNASGGLDINSNDGQDLLRRGDCPGSTLTCGRDSAGVLILDHTATTTSSAQVGANISIPINNLWSARIATGVQVTGSRLNGYTSTARELVVGDHSLQNAGDVESTNRGSRTATGGVYVEGALSAARLLYMTVGLRRDAGTSIGGEVAPSYPKWSISAIPPESWLLRVQPWISSFRIRTAFGHAGVQPGPADRYRTYGQATRFVDGKVVPALWISSPGNERLRPERGVEIEGGPDIGFWNERILLSYTAYRRSQRDAVYRQSIAPSFGAGGVRYENIGTVLNTGNEFSINVRAFDAPSFSWQLNSNVSWMRNRLRSLHSWINDPSLTRGVGYPLFGVWDRQLLGYADHDGDGMISLKEVLVGDELAFVGAPYPRYTAGLHSNMTLFNRLHVGMTFTSEHGVTQQNSALVGSGWMY